MDSNSFLGLHAIAWIGIQALVTGLGLIAILLVYHQVRIAVRTTQHESYNRLNDDFQKFLEIAAKNPDLRIYDFDNVQIQSYQERHQIEDPHYAIKELLHFAMLFSLWEHAYLDQQRKWMTESQWLGWHEWYEEYLRKDHVRDAWMIAARTFDSNFLHYVADHIIRPILGLRPDENIKTYVCGPYPEGIEVTKSHRKKQNPVSPPCRGTR